MQIQKIQSSTSFQTNKTRYIDEESHEQLVQILRKMDSETVYKSNDFSFSSTWTTRLELLNPAKNKISAELVDTRKSMKKYPEGKDLFKETCLTIGETQLVIDNKTGKIIDWYKPLLVSWKNILNKINMTLIAINASYHNPKIVKKHKFSIEGFTQKGFDILNKIKVK